MAVVGTGQYALDKIREMQGVINDQFEGAIQHLDRNSNELVDPGIEGSLRGGHADRFKGEIWPEFHGHLRTFHEQLNELNQQLDQLHAQIAEAGGGLGS